MASEQEVEAVRGDGSGAARESRTQQRRWVTQFTLGHLCTRNPEAMRMLGVGGGIASGKAVKSTVR